MHFLVPGTHNKKDCPTSVTAVCRDMFCSYNAKLDPPSRPCHTCLQSNFSSQQLSLLCHPSTCMAVCEGALNFVVALNVEWISPVEPLTSN